MNTSDTQPKGGANTSKKPIDISKEYKGALLDNHLKLFDDKGRLVWVNALGDYTSSGEAWFILQEIPKGAKIIRLDVRGRPSPLTPPTHTSDTLDEIIQAVWTDGTYTGSPNKGHISISPETAKSAIQHLIEQARLDELNKASESLTDSPLERPYFTERRAALEQKLEKS